MNAVITGASSGIGRALAATFAGQGHAVLAVARREERLLALCQELNAGSAQIASCLALDITAPGAPQALLDEAVQRFGQVHVLVNDAGMSPYQEFRELSYAHLGQILALNVCAASQLCALFMAHMLAHGQPSHVVNVSSVAGYAPLPRFAAYTASKHYLRALSNMLHYEYRGTNIRVSALYPGGTLTEFPALAGQRIRPAAQRSMMTPERVAELAYPAILRGQRLIVPGTLNKLAVLMGKLLPFPVAIRIMQFIYDRSMKPVPPTYPS